MRIPKSWVPPLAKRIINDLLKKGYIEIIFPEEELLTITNEILLDELMVEDRLNKEVREILRQHASEIEHKRLDYKTLFNITKQKLIKERNILL